MSEKAKQNGKLLDELSPSEVGLKDFAEDPLADTSELISQPVPPGVDRRSFLIRSAVGGAAAVLTGTIVSAHERVAKAVATLPVLQKPASPVPPRSRT